MIGQSDSYILNPYKRNLYSMIPIRTQTGSKIHILEPKCAGQNYLYPFHPLCMGGKNRLQYTNMGVKKLPSSATITCKRCLKITKIDQNRFFPHDNQHTPTNDIPPTPASSNANVYMTILLGVFLLIFGLWGILGV